MFDIENKSYDIVTCFDVIEHVVQDKPFFNKLLDVACEAVFITTPNFSRSSAVNIAHCREYSIGQFIQTFEPDELYVASPDGWFNMTKLFGCDRQLSNYGIDKLYNQKSVDGLEWPYMCGVFIES